jgi:hypothetical protein
MVDWIKFNQPYDKVLTNGLPFGFIAANSSVFPAFLNALFQASLISARHSVSIE